MADDLLRLSRGKLTDFLACRRRFQLRYVRQLPWPPAPPDAQLEAAAARGQQFHQLLQRHFLHLPVDAAALTDPLLRRWWRAFERFQPTLPAGRLLVELSLTVPVNAYLLTGRFDLLIIGERQGAPYAHLFDWKTGRARPAAAVRNDWQTRLYLALLAEGGAALWPAGAEPDPAQITLTYWYTSEPDAPQTIVYDAAWHVRNWAEIQAVVAQIEAQMAAGEWPLTEAWATCRACPFQVYCGRQAAGAAAAARQDEEPAAAAALEPELP